VTVVLSKVMGRLVLSVNFCNRKTAFSCLRC